MTEIYLVRHAQASFGSDNYDVLSELGHQQSQWLGEYFLNRNIHFDVVLTGTQRRHRETFEGIARACSSACRVTATADLNEFNFRVLAETYLVHNPEAKLAADAVPEDYFRLLKAAMSAWHQGLLDQYNLAETWAGFESRAKRALDSIEPDYSRPVLVVSSGGAIAMMLKQVLGFDDETVVKINLQIHNTSVSRIMVTRNGFHLASFNTIAHLDQPERRYAITYS